MTDEMIAAFLDGNVTADEANDVLASISGNPDVSEILSLSPLVDMEVKANKKNIIPIHALAAANPRNMCSFDCEAFILRQYDYDTDHWSLLETAKTNNWLREEGTPLHHVGRLLELKGMYVKRQYDSSYEDLENALAANLEVIAVVDKGLLHGGEPECRGDNPEYHAIYVTSIEKGRGVLFLNLDTLLAEIVEKDIFLRAWECSGHYMVTASMTPSGYNPQPINVDEIDLGADLKDLTEAIAENAHDIWARARMDEGWTYGPVRDDAGMKHPDLVPYAQLPESEKEYDRIMAMNTLRLMRRLGYEIISED